MDKRHPYVGLPDYQFWRKEIAIEVPEQFDPVKHVSFTIEKDDPVVTAGSCFAQHVARHLAGSGFNFLVTERAHPLIPKEISKKYHYGMFTARYGNIYTARQLKQLLQRAYGQFEPLESVWGGPAGEILDPFRPQIHPGGFVSEAELLDDRETHFAALRKAVEAMSVFIFTLGLTETWLDTRDGAVFPIAPGVAGGKFDPTHHHFHNLSVQEVVEDMQWSIDFIRQRNPGARLLITVSPVALNATALDRHVFVSTTHSKAVLRVAADIICGRNGLCDYFPSYEIITSPYARGQYFAPDCRDVLNAGVEHVMSIFLKHYGGVMQPDIERPAPSTTQTANQIAQQHSERMTEMMEVLCDEERISNH